MESEKLSQDKRNDNQNDILKDKLKNIKSKYILSKIYDNLEKKKKPEIVKYNKKIQKILSLNIQDYEEYCKIEIEIIICDDKYSEFININKNDKNIIIYILMK